MPSPVNITGFRQTVFNWLTQVTEQTVIFEFPNQPRPKTPYVSIQLITGPVKGGQDDTINQETGTKFDVVGQRSITANIKAHGGDAVQTLADVQSSIDVPATIELLGSNNVAIFDDSPILNITEILESGFEERASMDVIFGIVSDQEIDPGTIDKTVVSGTYVKPDQSTISVGPETIGT